jgi:REP element-mobilizing transposase RayT
MARPLRLEYPGALYHVSSRGNGGTKISRSDKDRNVFLAILDAVILKYHWLLHAYCLMDNHYHLVVETPDGNLSRGMRQLNGMYTQKFNWRHHLTGHVLQGRYKAIFVDKESYLLELCRYVVLNPVRAKIREKPEDWPWSSYRPTAGLSSSPSFLTTDWVLGQFGRKKKQAQSRYRAFVLEGITKESPWAEVKGQIFLGDTSFVDTFRTLLKDKNQIKEIPRAQRLVERPPLEDLFKGTRAKENRNRSIHQAHVTHAYTLSEIARHLGLHYTTVSKIVKRTGEEK